MSALARFRALAARRFRRDWERDVERELAAHLELEAEDRRDRGASADEAYYAARRALGSTALVAEDARAVWHSGLVDGFVRDLRYSARSLRRNAGFTAVAVLTLGLGIGANTAIFTAVDAVMLRPLPFAGADRLVRLYATKDGEPSAGFTASGPSPLSVRDYAADSRSFDGMVAYDAWRKNVSFADVGTDPEERRVGLVPPAYFEILGVRPIMGRLFAVDEGREGADHVAAVSAQIWKSRFGGDPSILGRTVRINGEPYTIVAVIPDVIPEWMEPGRSGAIEIWTPFAFSDVWAETARGVRGFSALARMKPGVSLEQAQAELLTIAAALAASHPASRGIGVELKRLADTRAGSLRPMLLLLVGAVALILLIACVNLANLLLARNATRHRELALRAALGAGPVRLARQLLAETLILSLAGALVGLALAQGAVVVLAKTHASTLPQLASMTVDRRVLVFTLSLTLATNFLLGLAPAFAAARANVIDALKEGGRSAMNGAGGHRLRDALVAAEVAMSLMLLVGAGLLVQSILRLEHQALGIRQERLLKGHFYLPSVRYPDAGSIARFSDEFARRVRLLPGVVDATITTAYPPANGWTQMLGIPGHEASRLEDVPSAQFGVTDTHFLSTLGIRLVHGRDFSDADSDTTPPAALVSEEFQRRYFAGQDPIGRQIHVGPPSFLNVSPGANTTDAADVTIVGVIGDFRNAGLAVPPEPHITVLYRQHPLVNYGFKDIVVRAATDPQALVPAIRRELRQLDADMPFAEVQTIEEFVAQQTGAQRFTTVLLVSFAAGGLALALVGIYGVVSFLVAQRRQELAVRIAIGASRCGVLWLVVRDSLGMATVGAILGLMGARFAERLTSRIVFGISPVDPLTFAAGACVLLVVAAAASVIPALRALRIDPSRALRLE